MKNYDTVIIGSGIGGLTAGLCHAHAGEEVIIIEQHDVPGGWCHSFTLEGHLFNTGVHYIGELSEGARIREIFEGLGLGGDLTFCELNPEGYEHVYLNGSRYDIPKGREALKEYLTKHFPHEKKGIARLLKKTEKIAKEIGSMLDMDKLTDLVKMPFVAPSIMIWGFASYDRFLRHYIKDEQLVGLLSSQAGDYAMPTKKAVSPMHVGIFEHYMDGAFYPVGGGYKIPKAYLRAFKKYNGELLLKTRVEEILTEGVGKSRTVSGVRLNNGEIIHCKKVISNADPHQTFTKMLSVDSLSKRLQKKLARTRYSVSCLGLFLTVDLDLKSMGFDSGNYWVYGSNDINDIFHKCMDVNVVDEEEFPFFYLTVTSLKDPSKKNKNLHTIEAFTYLPFAPFEKWKDTETGNRPDDYIEFKEMLKERYLDNIEKLIPDIRGSIKLCEMGTPLTNMSYINCTEGSIFGTEKNIFQTGMFILPPKTEIKNLYICGGSTLHGIFGASISALFTSKISLKLTTKELLGYKDKEITVYQSEDMASWPEKHHEAIRKNWRI